MDQKRSVFIPLFTSHTYNHPALDLRALLAFLAFGLTASGHYFLNDLVDLDADRAHRSKRNRPLASGDLPILCGIFGAILLTFGPIAVVGDAAQKSYSSLVGYLVLTNLYSFFLKSKSTADVFALALLYTIRVVAGGAAVGIVLSSWLLAFSIFLFVSLAYLKRYIELRSIAAGQIKGRGYIKEDAEPMFVLGIANSTAAIVVLAYISSPEVRMPHRFPPCSGASAF